MEGSNQSHTTKTNGEKAVNNSSAAPEQPDEVEAEPNSPNLSNSSTATESNEQVDAGSTGEVENPNTNEEEEEEEDDQDDFVVYDSEKDDDKDEDDTITDSNNDQPRSVRRRRSSSGPAIGSFTVQCHSCFKWRIVPTKEKYEEIRENLIEEPFSCEHAKAWNPESCCDDPPDITPDGTRLWAIDRPSIPRAPHGWERLLKFRVEGSSKFADVYYVAPSGKRFRSMVEVQRYLDENPRYKEEGVSKSQFSFQIPKPLRENYVRKRSAASNNGIQESSEITEVNPISEEEIGPKMNGLGSSDNNDAESPQNAVSEPPKKRKLSLEKKSHEDLTIT